MTMKTQFFFVLRPLMLGALLFGLFEVGWAQVEMPDLIPPSPDAAAYAKYVDIPVSYYTGMTNISIPIYELKGRNLSIPISMSYHASGIRVEEIASRFGLGWVLNGGGIITRTLRGLPDDLQGIGYLDQNYTISDMENLPDDSDMTLNDYLAIQNEVNNGILDLEPDLFSFNAVGLSGKFIIDKDNLKVLPIPHQNLDINFYRNNDGEIFKWVITKPDGVKYIFGQSELDNTRNAIEIQEVLSDEDFPSLSQTPYISAWYLTEVIAPDGEHIELFYSPYSASYCRTASTDIFILPSSSTAGSCSPDIQPVASSTILIEGVYISYIKSLKGEVHFIPTTNDREDLPPNISSTHATDRAIDYIEIRDYSSNYCRKFDFDYSYFSSPFVTGNYCGSDPTPYRKRLRLDKITEKFDEDLKKPPYVFSYHSTELPHRFSAARDHWGFFNGKTDNTSLIPAYLYSNFEHMELVGTIPGADRQPDVQAMQAGVLTKIKYPTGGETEFTYEAHDYLGTDYIFELDGGGMTDLKAEVKGINANTPGGIGYQDVQPFSVFGLRYGAGNILGKIVKVSRWIDNPVSGMSCEYTDDDQTNTCDVNIIIKKVTNGTSNSVMTSLYDTPTESYYFLHNGNYELILEVDPVAYQNPDPAYDYVDYVTCQVLTIPGANKYNKPVGGLRIQKIEVKESASSTNPLVRQFEYKSPTHPNESSGVLTAEPFYHHIDYKVKTIYDSDPSGNNPALDYLCDYLVRRGNSNGYVDGTHIGYKTVQMYLGANKEEGKSEFFYTTFDDYPNLPDPATVDYEYPFAPLQNYEWKRGLLTKEIHSRWNGVGYSPITENIYEYDFILYPQFDREIPGIVFGCDFDIERTTGCDGLIVKGYQTVSGWHYLKKQSQKTFGQFDPVNQNTIETFYHYDNPDHLQNTRTYSINSDGRISQTKNKYPEDYLNTSSFPSGISIQDMIDQNLVGFPIETQTWEGSNLNSLNLTSSSISIFKDFGMSSQPVIKPHQTFLLETSANIPKTTVEPAEGLDASGKYTNIIPGSFTSPFDQAAFAERISMEYDVSGILLQFLIPGATSEAFIWGFNNTMPTAQVINANYNDIAYTSFEEVGNTAEGNWKLYWSDNRPDPMGGWSGIGGAKTGQRRFDLDPQRNCSTTVAKAGDYLLSYWYLRTDPAQTDLIVNVPYMNKVEEAYPDGWTYYEKEISLVAGQTLILQGSSTGPRIDELRLSPIGAQMTTYCYDTKLRLITVTDINGRSTYYEYDGLGRLKTVKDHNRDIRSINTYHYKQ